MEESEDIAERINIRYGVKSINESIKFYQDKIKELEKQRDELQKSIKTSYDKGVGKRIRMDKLPYGREMIGKRVRHSPSGGIGNIISLGTLATSYYIGYDNGDTSAHLSKFLELLD